jgi:GDPmannose 4,6-dehydratase
LDARRDWGDAEDYVELMWLMLQQPRPDDYVLATGEAHSVREFIELAFQVVGRRIEWWGSGVDEAGVDVGTGDELVRVDPSYFRPTEIDELIGNAGKARQALGWAPETSITELVAKMLKSDLKTVGLEIERKDRGNHWKPGRA